MSRRILGTDATGWARQERTAPVRRLAWSQLRFRLWSKPVNPPEGATAYDVGYMSVNGRN